MGTRSRRWMERICVALFDALLRAWPENERREFGPSMRQMFARRLKEDGGPRIVVALRELASVVGLGLSSRLQRRRRRAGAGSLGLDARQALRSVLRRPRLSLLVVSTHAFGLGLAASAFAVFEATLLRPLPYPQGDRLVALWSTRDGVPTPWGNVSWLDLMDLRASSTTLATLGGHVGPAPAAVGGIDRPWLTTMTEVTPGFFETFGIGPERGRLFEDADHETGGVALVSHDAWLTRFGGDPGIVGRVIDLDDSAVRLVGVLPPAARFYPSPDVGFWLPYVPGGQSRGSRNLVAVGRLADGRDLAAASDEIRALTTGLAAAFPDSNDGVSARVQPLTEQMMGGELPHMLGLLLAATVALLLLAGANVAGLVLARAQERAGELAVRASLGASGSRLVRPLLLEGLFLAAAGGGAALVIAGWLPPLALSMAPLDLPRAVEVGLDTRVLVFAVAGTLLLTVLASLAPAWSVVRRSLRVGLGGGRNASATGTLRAREMLIVLQVAGTLALLTAAGLTLRSLDRITAVDPGFDADRVAAVSLRLERGRFPGAAEVFGFHEALLREISALPGVARAAAVSMVPFGGGSLCDDLAVDCAEPVYDCVQYRSVSPGYFAVMGIDLLRGRDFVVEDGPDAPRVAMLSRTTAAAAFPGSDALGRVIEGRGGRWTVVGVVEDSRLAGLDGPAPPVVYLPFHQAPARLVTAVARGDDATALAGTLADAVRSVDPSLAVRETATLRQLVRGATAEHRFRGVLFGAAGALALFLSILGLSGLLLQLAHERRQEIGLRMALGSTRSAVVRSVLARAMTATATGVALGLGAALATGRVLAGYLFGVSPVDLPALVGAAGALVLAAVVASAGPAARAASVDPARTLRDE
jgi:predicted permease